MRKGEGMSPCRLTTLQEALGLVRDGDKVAISGNMDMSPMELIRGLIREGKRDLRLVCAGAAGINADLLIGSDVLRSVEFSQISLGEYGFAPSFRRRFEQGAIIGLEHACPTLASALQAGAMGIPFMPVRGLIGTDYMKIRDDFRCLTNPYNPNEEIAVVPAISPDVALFHGFAADPEGNVMASSSQNNRILAQASRVAIASVEKIVPVEELRRMEGTWIPSVLLTAVVHLPNGAWPAGCADQYLPDGEHIELYAAAAKSDEGIHAYLKRFVHQQEEAVHG